MKSRFIVAAYAVVAVAIVLPVVGLDTLPLTDLPNHLAEATILKHAADPTSLLAEFFSPSRVVWFQPGIAHAVFCSWFASVESSNRFLYVLYCLAIPLSMLSIAYMCEGSWVIALLSTVTIWNFSAIWGFSGFTMGIPIVLLSVSLHIRSITKGSISNIVLIGLSFILLYWFHVLVFLFALVSFVLIEFSILAATSTSRLRALGRFTAVLPATTMFTTWVWKGSEFEGGGTALFLKEYYLHRYVPGLWGRFADFLTIDWAHIAYGRTGKAIALIFSLLLLIPTVVCLFRIRHRTVTLTAPRCATLAFASTALFCCAFLPDFLPAQYCLYERFTVFCYLGLIGALSWMVPICWPKLRHAVVVVAATVGYAVLFGHYFWTFRAMDNEFVSFVRTGPTMKGRMVAYLIDEPNFRGRATLLHYNNYQIIWNLSPTPTKVGEYRFGMISQAGSLPSYPEWLCRQDSSYFPPLIDSYSKCDFLVAQGKRPRDAIARRRDFVLVHEVGRWSLFGRSGTGDEQSKATTVKPTGS